MQIRATALWFWSSGGKFFQSLAWTFQGQKNTDNTDGFSKLLSFPFKKTCEWKIWLFITLLSECAKSKCCWLLRHAESEKTLGYILPFGWHSSVQPETVVSLLTSFTDTVTCVAMLTGSVICSHLSSVGVQASLACLYKPQQDHSRNPNVWKEYMFSVCLVNVLLAW